MRADEELLVDVRLQKVVLVVLQDRFVVLVKATPAAEVVGTCSDVLEDAGVVIGW